MEKTGKKGGYGQIYMDAGKIVKWITHKPQVFVNYDFSAKKGDVKARLFDVSCQKEVKIAKLMEQHGIGPKV